MLAIENRSGAAFLAVSTGSAERQRSQPGLKQSSPNQEKPSVRGQWTEGSFVRSSRFDGATP